MIEMIVALAAVGLVAFTIVWFSIAALVDELFRWRPPTAHR